MKRERKEQPSAECKATPLVTVIISSFNRPTLVQDAIRSVLEQTYQNLQVVIADDWSNQETNDVLRQFCKDDRVELLTVGFDPTYPVGEAPTDYERQFGGRCAKGVNEGLRRTRGDYVCFLPDDDFMTPDSIEKRVAFLEKNPKATVVYGRLEGCACDPPMSGIHFEPQVRTVTRPEQRPFGVSEESGEFVYGCMHERNTFYVEHPIPRAANHIDHSMIMARTGNLPTWPEAPTTEWIHNGKPYENESREQGWGTRWEHFDCPDAGWLFRLELAGLGPFYSISDYVTIKRYGHGHGHRTDPSRRE